MEEINLDLESNSHKNIDLNSNLIADTGFNGGIEYNGKVLNFTSGYLDSYSVNFSIDSLPQSSINMLLIDEEIDPNTFDFLTKC